MERTAVIIGVAVSLCIAAGLGWALSVLCHQLHSLGGDGARDLWEDIIG